MVLLVFPIISSRRYGASDCGADCVSGSRGDKGVSFDFQNLRNVLEFLKGEVDRLIDRIDVGLGPYGSKNRVGPDWAAVAELKPNSAERTRASQESPVGLKP